jgi:hypothetical protein
MRRFLQVAAILLCACAAQSVASPIPLDQLPPGHLQLAQDKMRSLNHPDVKFDSACLKKDGTYEIRGKDSRGKSWEVEIDKNGNVTLD